MYICLCNAITERQIILAAEEGARSPEDLTHALGVGLGCDLKLELAAHPALKAAIADCEACGDYVSRDLFRSILDSEEHHINWLETQLDLIEKVGIANYQQSQMHG